MERLSRKQRRYLRKKLLSEGLSVSYRSSEKKVLDLKGAFRRTFNRPLSKLLLLQFHAKAIVRLTLEKESFRDQR